MEDSHTNAPAEIPAAERKLLAGAEPRMARSIQAIGVVGTLLCWLWMGWGWGLGFAVGAILSALNFHWMRAAVGAVADLASSQELGQDARPSSAGRSVRAGIGFLLRYALIGVAAYVIFKSSFVSLGAFFLGLFSFLAAILVEVGFQIVRGFRNA